MSRSSSARARSTMCRPSTDGRLKRIMQRRRARVDGVLRPNGRRAAHKVTRWPGTDLGARLANTRLARSPQSAVCRTTKQPRRERSCGCGTDEHASLEAGRTEGTCGPISPRIGVLGVVSPVPRRLARKPATAPTRTIVRHARQRSHSGRKLASLGAGPPAQAGENNEPRVSAKPVPIHHNGFDARRRVLELRLSTDDRHRAMSAQNPMRRKRSIRSSNGWARRSSRVQSHRCWVGESEKHAPHSVTTRQTASHLVLREQRIGGMHGHEGSARKMQMQDARSARCVSWCALDRACARGEHQRYPGPVRIWADAGGSSPDEIARRP